MSIRKPRTRRQFRLTWLRDGINEKKKLFISRALAERFIRILTADEPWREWDEDAGPDDYACCPGGSHYQCGCGGYTHAEVRDQKRKDLPRILWIRIDERTITATAWEQQLLTELAGDRVTQHGKEKM